MATVHSILGAPKTSLEEMKIGDYIPCKYTAFVSGQVGYFSELGTTTAPEISTIGNDNTVPNGSFNFIKVDRGLLIADRNIQCSMSWNTLNSKGLIEGTNFPCFLPTTSFTVNKSGNGMSTTGSLISGVSTSSRTASSGWGIFQAYNDTNSSNLLSAVLRINKVRMISGTVEGAYVSFYINKLNGSMLYINIYDYDDTQYLIGFEGGSLFIPKSEGITVAMSLLNDKIYINGIIIDGIALPGGTTTNRIMFNHVYPDGEGGSIETDVERVEYIRSANIDVSKLLPTNLLVRSLTGGVARLNTQGYPTLENANAVGGFPPTNEFDKYIINSSLNGKITPSDQSVWNANSWSHVKETALTGLKNVDGNSAPSGTSRVLRGGMNYAPYGPMGYLGQASATYSDIYTCFRPVLEYIEPDGSSKQETIWR